MSKANYLMGKLKYWIKILTFKKSSLKNKLRSIKVIYKKIIFKKNTVKMLTATRLFCSIREYAVNVVVEITIVVEAQKNTQNASRYFITLSYLNSFFLIS